MDCWSLENDLVTRRLQEDPEVVEEPGGFSLTIRSLFETLRSGDRIGTLVYLDPEAFEAVSKPEIFDPEIAVWNPEEPVGSSLDPEIFDWNPEAIREPGGTVLRLPRQDYYWYLFGFCILPLGSWPLSSSYAVFYFCKKSLTGLEGAGVGVMTQVPGLRCFPLLEKHDLDCSLTFHIGTLATPMRLRLHRGFSGRATFVRVGQDQRSMET
ncbi:hypothetical protein F2Q70_00011209 [Brassica cretica]|uniref:Uncharacterized protein n=1 Tax=Brassica cretica TaxID=69181 RepID=A0A8S9M1I9_BRACR|nr:hypothetical protein F2Q70_00011209 [Brassica cretica]